MKQLTREPSLGNTFAISTLLFSKKQKNCRRQNSFLQHVQQVQGNSLHFKLPHFKSKCAILFRKIQGKKTGLKKPLKQSSKATQTTCVWSQNDYINT